ncbi:MAG: protein kinase [Gemmataceae bacterium]
MPNHSPPNQAAKTHLDRQARFDENEVMSELTPGTRVGDYVVQKLLGRGGMGAVYLARHQHMDREVALKVLSSEVANVTKALRRFEREVRISAKMNHPHLVRAYDASTHNGLLYLVMEYVDGCTLHELVSLNGPLPLEEVVLLLAQAARGLGHVHHHGFVHRDFKPSNVMVDVSATVKILDLGLSGLAAGSRENVSGEPLTNQGEFMGTLHFMAPEQIVCSHQVDARADIYSFGCTFYNLLTGTTPFPDTTRAALVQAHQMDSVPSVTSLGGMSARVNAMLRKLMAKNPEDRYSSMGEVVTDLQALRNDNVVSNAATVSRIQSVRSGPIRSQATTRSFSQRPQAGRPSPIALMWLVICAVGLLLSIAIGIGYLLYGSGQTNRDHRAPTQKPGEGVVIANAVGDAKFEPVGFPTDGTPQQQFDWVLNELKKANPNWDGTGCKFVQAEGGGYVLELTHDKIVKLAPLRHLRSLDVLHIRYSLASDFQPLAKLPVSIFICQSEGLTDVSFLQTMPYVVHVSFNGSTKLTDLSPLNEMAFDQLKVFVCSDTNVKDLSPLRGHVGLQSFNCRRSRVASLEPLAELRIERLVISECLNITDLKPLIKLQLRVFEMDGCVGVTDLSPLNEQPIESLSLVGCTRVKDIAPVGTLSKLEALDIRGCGKVLDLTPLKGLKLKELWCDRGHLKGAPFLREMVSLKTINDRDSLRVWRELDKK